MVSYLDTTLVDDAEHTPKNRISQYLEILFGLCFLFYGIAKSRKYERVKGLNKWCENTKTASNTEFEAVAFRANVKAYL